MRDRRAGLLVDPPRKGVAKTQLLAGVRTTASSQSPRSSNSQLRRCSQGGSARGDGASIQLSGSVSSHQSTVRWCRNRWTQPSGRRDGLPGSCNASRRAGWLPGHDREARTGCWERPEIAVIPCGATRGVDPSSRETLSTRSFRWDVGFRIDVADTFCSRFGALLIRSVSTTVGVGSARSRHTTMQDPQRKAPQCSASSSASLSWD